MFSSPFLPLPPGLEILATDSRDDLLCVEVVSTRSGSRCPLCFHLATRIHSRYTRIAADVPSGGLQVQLVLHVRKFFCDTSECPRKIFTERLPVFVHPWARMTTRLCQMLQALGLATCGELGARLAGRLGMHTSPTTLLRQVMARPSSPPGPVSSLGIDDFSFRRGRKFGTILVDLDRHQVIDLLADRKTETAAAWMQTHNEIKIVSRDRAEDYAAAARKGASQAIQTADRFHLTKNLVEAIEPLVARSYKEIRKAQVLPPPSALPKAKEWRQAIDANAEGNRLARLAYNQERYAQVIDLHLRGVKQEEIASRLGISKRTLQRWMEQGAGPGSARRRKRRSIFDPYAPYVLARWQQGCRDGAVKRDFNKSLLTCVMSGFPLDSFDFSQSDERKSLIISLLWQEIRDQGFSGKIQTVYRFIRTLRQGPVELPAPSVLDRVSVQEALWLIVRPFDTLKADERADLQELCQASQELETLHALVQSFGQIVRKREGHRLEAWMKQVTDSGLADVQRFAKGLEGDKAAVLAGLTLVYSNGQVEGQVNKLKLLKRTMYGRAEFPLLRQRALHAV